MIRGVAFDMDGVLIDARDWHYQALNEALELFGYTIPYPDHLATFDGLPTKVKLEILSETQALPRHLHPLINEIKQERTLRLAAAQCYPRPNHLSIMNYIKKLDLPIVLATNSIRETTLSMMTHAGLVTFFTHILTNQDVTISKPDPQIYLLAAKKLNIDPSELLVFEDNPNGIKAATSAGCQVIVVENPDSLHLDSVIQALKETS